MDRDNPAFIRLNAILYLATIMMFLSINSGCERAPNKTIPNTDTSFPLFVTVSIPPTAAPQDAASAIKNPGARKPEIAAQVVQPQLPLQFVVTAWNVSNEEINIRFWWGAKKEDAFLCEFINMRTGKIYVPWDPRKRQLGEGLIHLQWLPGLTLKPREGLKMNFDIPEKFLRKLPSGLYKVRISFSPFFLATPSESFGWEPNWKMLQDEVRLFIPTVNKEEKRREQIRK